MFNLHSDQEQVHIQSGLAETSLMDTALLKPRPANIFTAETGAEVR